MIAVVDTGGANLRSVANALARLGVAAELTSRPQRLREAQKVILPGVGAAADAMRRLHEAGLVEVLRDLRQPILGICLGMQLLFGESEEVDAATARQTPGSVTPCLGLLPGRVRRLPAAEARVPHVGWNDVAQVRPSALLPPPGISAGPDPRCFYFVHSYLVPDGPWVTGETKHGSVAFPAVIEAGRVMGVQFHPEKSQGAGARLLEAFVRL